MYNLLHLPLNLCYQDSTFLVIPVKDTGLKPQTVHMRRFLSHL